MGDIAIKTNVFPFRFSMKDKNTVELSLEVANESSEAKMITLSIMLPKQVSFSKGGTNYDFQKEYDALKAGQKIQMKIPLYLSAETEPGTFDGMVKIEEHYNEFGYVMRTYSKPLVLRVVD
jgi:hypothetical protein